MSDDADSIEQEVRRYAMLPATRAALIDRLLLVIRDTFDEFDPVPDDLGYFTQEEYIEHVRMKLGDWQQVETLVEDLAWWLRRLRDRAKLLREKIDQRKAQGFM